MKGFCCNCRVGCFVCIVVGCIRFFWDAVLLGWVDCVIVVWLEEGVV